MTIYTQDQIEDMLDDLRAILDVRVRWNATYESVSADYDMEAGELIIRWYDHIDPDRRKIGCDRKISMPIHSLSEEIDSQREKLFEDLSDEDVQVLTDVLLNYGE